VFETPIGRVLFLFPLA
jgi:threonine/homoserine/homoserine lactone efflux protein